MHRTEIKSFIASSAHLFGLQPRSKLQRRQWATARATSILSAQYMQKLIAFTICQKHTHTICVKERQQADKYIIPLSYKLFVHFSVYLCDDVRSCLFRKHSHRPQTSNNTSPTALSALENAFRICCCCKALINFSF